jgi:serine/threonine protein kinase
LIDEILCQIGAFSKGEIFLGISKEEKKLFSIKKIKSKDISANENISDVIFVDKFKEGSYEYIISDFSDFGPLMKLIEECRQKGELIPEKVYLFYF